MTNTSKYREFWINANSTEERYDIIFKTDPGGNWPMHFDVEPVHVVEYAAIHAAERQLVRYEEVLAEKEKQLEEISRHLYSLEHSIKRYQEVGKEHIALVKIMPEIKRIRETLNKGKA